MILKDLLSDFVKHFPQDAWTAEVAMVYATDEGRQIDAICGVGMIPFDNTFIIAVMGESEINRVKKSTGGLPERGERIPHDIITADNWSI